jgi:hypothetical protein
MVHLVFRRTMQANWRAKVQLHAFLTFTLDGGEWSDSRPGRFIPTKPSVSSEREAIWSPKTLRTLIFLFQESSQNSLVVHPQPSNYFRLIISAIFRVSLPKSGQDFGSMFLLLIVLIVVKLTTLLNAQLSGQDFGFMFLLLIVLIVKLRTLLNAKLSGQDFGSMFLLLIVLIVKLTTLLNAKLS